MSSKISFSIPIQLPSLANARMHHMELARIKAKQRAAVALGFPPKAKQALITGRWHSVVVVMRRVSARELDSDNLQGAFKSVRDEIAKQLGLRDDRDARVGWLYQQEKCRPVYRRIEIDFVPMVEQPEVRA